MQEQHMDALMSSLKKSSFRADELSERIATETINLPVGARTPNADELQAMRDFARQYQKQSPKVSARAVRRAIQRKFNVTILPNSLNI